MFNEAVIPPWAHTMTASTLSSIKSPVEPALRACQQKHARLTYKEFEEHIRKLLAADEWSAQRIANITSALHDFMRALELYPVDVIGDEFGVAFAESFRRYEDNIADRLAPRTQKDRQEQVQKLQQLYDALSIHDLLPAVFGDALAYAVDRSGETLAHIGRLSGILPQVLGVWMHGKGTPQHQTSYARIPGLESALGLPLGTLLSRLPPRRRARYERRKKEVADSAPTPKQLSKTVCPSLRPTDRLKWQWEEMIRCKTDITREGATARNTWRLKAVENSGFRINWSHMLDGSVCATAGVHWAMFGPFLGFIATHAVRGRTVPLEHADSLAWLASTTHVKAFVQFLRARAGNVTHHGVVTFINNARSHLRAGTGFLWQRHDFLDDLCAAGDAQALALASRSDREAGWQSYCTTSHLELLKLEKSLAVQSPARCVRRPAQRIESILGDEFPLKRLIRIVLDLEADEPPQGHERDYAAWVRDVLLCKMLVSNPLRVAQLSIMRFRGNRSNLYQTADGGWRLRYDPSDFKNEKGAASQEYDTAVEPSVWPWIRRFLSEARSALVGADTEYVFLPAVVGPNRRAGYDALNIEGNNWVADSLGKRVTLVTSRYAPEGVGFGPHAFRHIIATDHLKRHPQDYVTVAQLLHDKLETVIKAYAHLKVDDSLRTLHAGVAQALAELK